MGIKRTGKVKPLKLTATAPGPKARPATKALLLGKAVSPIIKVPNAKPRSR